MISKIEFKEWKDHPVTEAIFTAIREMEASVIDQLIQNVDEGSLPDEYLRGYIIALRDVCNVDLAEESGE